MREGAMTGKVLLITKRLCGGCQEAKAALRGAGLLDAVTVVELDRPRVTQRQTVEAAEGLALYTIYRGVNDTLPLFVIDHTTGPVELTNKVARAVEHIKRHED